MAKIEEEYREPFDAWASSPGPKTAGEMLRHLQPVIDYGLRQYTGHATANPILRGKAKKLTLAALETYDPDKGSLKTHILSNLQRLQREAMRQRQIISVPERVVMDKLQTENAMQELEDKLGREPSDQELADYTGLSLKRLEYVRRAATPRPEQAELDLYGRRHGIPNQKQLADYRQWLELVYSDLDPINQAIMERGLGLHGHQRMSGKAIAKKLKLSPGAVSQRMSAIQQKIDQFDQIPL